MHNRLTPDLAWLRRTLGADLPYLRGYWSSQRGGRGPNSSLLDLSTGGFDGSPSGGPYVDETGFQFDGSDDYYDVGTMGSFGTKLQTHTAIIWAKWTDGTDWACPFGTICTDAQQMMMFVNRTGSYAFSVGDVSYFLREGGENRYYQYTNGESFNDGGYHMFAWVVKDAATPDGVLYVDGVEVSTNQNHTANPTAFGNFDTEVLLGARSTAAGGSERHFAGSLDEIMFFNKVIDPEKLQAIYNAAKWRLP